MGFYDFLMNLLDYGFTFLLFCIVLSVFLASVVAKVMKVRNARINAQERVLLKSIEMGQPVNVDILLDKKGSNKKGSLKLTLLRRLQYGIAFSLMGLFMLVFSLINSYSEAGLVFAFIFLSLGVALIVAFFVGKKILTKELDEIESDSEESVNKM